MRAYWHTQDTKETINKAIENQMTIEVEEPKTPPSRGGQGKR